MTVSGAPEVMVVAFVTSPVLAVKPPVGTKLKATWIGTAQAGRALKAATAEMKSVAGTPKFWDGTAWKDLPSGFTLADSNNFAVGFYKTGDTYTWVNRHIVEGRHALAEQVAS